MTDHKSKMFIFVLLPLLSSAQSNNQTDLDKLEDALYRKFSEVWPFFKGFPEMRDLRVQRSELYEGISNEGIWTDYSLRKIIAKILNGEKIRLLIVGESISAGANLGCRNNKRTYHYGLAKWWLKTITEATGSRLIRHQIAVGGVATNYFDRCWKEYLYKNETFDLVLWEFSFNDADAIHQSKSIERFTRSVAEVQDIPGLIFVSFFRRNFFERYTSRKVENPCNKIIDEVNRRHEEHEITIATVAKYYSVTLLDLERTVCSALERNSSALNMQLMFSTDHPSFLAHAQMTFMLIHYLRQTFAKIVTKLKGDANREKINRYHLNTAFKRKFGLQQLKKIKPKNIYHKNEYLPRPIFLTFDEANFNSQPICWSAVLPNVHIKPKHYLFDLKTTHSKSFSKLEKNDWRDADERRFDATGGFVTTKTNQSIEFEFTINSSAEQSRWRVSLAIRNKFFGGKIEVVLRGYRKAATTDNIISTDVFDSSTKDYSGVNVFDLSKKTPAGKKYLLVRTLTGGVHICGIVIS